MCCVWEAIGEVKKWLKVIRNPTEIFGFRSNLYQMPKWLFWEGSKIGPPRFWGVFWCFGFKTPKGFEVFLDMSKTIPQKGQKESDFWRLKNTMFGKGFSDMSKNTPKRVQKESAFWRDPKRPKRVKNDPFFGTLIIRVIGLHPKRISDTPRGTIFR